MGKGVSFSEFLP